MSLHDALYSSAADVLLETFGHDGPAAGDADDRLRYRQPGRDWQSLRGSIGNERTEERLVGETIRNVYTRSVLVGRDPEGPHPGLADPAMHGEVEIDGVAYAVEGIVGAGPSLVRLLLVRAVATELTRPDYRQR